MNMKDLEWEIGILAGAKIFDKEKQETLVTARDIISAVRAALDLPQNFNAKDIVGEIWRVADVNKEGA